MRQIVFWQLMMLIVAICLAVWWRQPASVWSALWGGLAYFLPTLIAVAMLSVMRRNPEWLSIALLMAEITKILLVCLMMLAVYLVYPPLDWPAFLLGLILVSQAGLFTFRKRSLL